MVMQYLQILLNKSNYALLGMTWLTRYMSTKYVCHLSQQGGKSWILMTHWWWVFMLSLLLCLHHSCKANHNQPSNYQTIKINDKCANTHYHEQIHTHNIDWGVQITQPINVIKWLKNKLTKPIRKYNLATKYCFDDKFMIKILIHNARISLIELLSMVKEISFHYNISRFLYHSTHNVYFD